MVSLDTGTGEGSPTVLECRNCGTTLVASQEPDEVTCCDRPMIPLEGEEGLLNEPRLDVILQEVFGLSHNAIVICIVVIERGPVTTEEITETVGVSNSTVSRVLSHLVDVGILTRYPRNLQSGGTVNVYEAVPIEEQREIYRRGLYQWFGASIEAVDAFDLEELKAQYRTDSAEDPEPMERAAIYWDSEPDPASSD